MLDEWKDNRVLITGASRGIGGFICLSKRLCEHDNVQYGQGASGR